MSKKVKTAVHPKNGWIILMLVVATLFYLYEFMLRVLPAPLFSYLMKDFSIDAPALAILSSSYLFSYALLQVPVGAWVDKVGPRRLLTIAIFLCAISTLIFARTEIYFWVCIARLLIGAGSAFAFICCMKVITLWLPARYFPIATGLTLTLGTLGAVVGQRPIASLLDNYVWREIMWGLGIFGLVLALLAWLIIRDHNPRRPELAADSSLPLWVSLKQIVRQKQNWLVAIYAFLITGPTDAFGGMWGVPYFVQGLGFDLKAANTATSMIFIGMACGSPLIGWVSGVIQARKILMLVGSVGAAISLAGILFMTTLTPVQANALCFSYGFLSSYVLAFVVIRDRVDPIYVGTAVGFVNFASMVGSFLLTSGVGFLLQYFDGSTVVEGVKLYDKQAYLFALFPLLLFYILSACCIIPGIKESFPKNG